MVAPHDPDGRPLPFDLRFGWELRGSGWATCRVADGASEQVDVVSYCTDALRDLLKAVAGLYGAAASQRVSFDLEPAEVRWRLRRQGSEVDITIYRYPDMSESWNAPDDEGTRCWHSTQPRSALGHVVVEAAEAVLRTHGEAGYLEKWIQHPFPGEALDNLRRLHRRDDECRHEDCQGNADL
ncbi:hypothetical protein GCM10010415_22690 [Streptomyces atrovirens]|uniref:Uncharacterized protein n=1 Tax=Streptomyces atrovirens TaxID=285556 RepID=A0ABW0DSS7_9ACTN